MIFIEICFKGAVYIQGCAKFGHNEQSGITRGYTVTEQKFCCAVEKKEKFYNDVSPL